MKRRRQGGLRQRQQAKESEEADEIMRNAAYTATSGLATYLLTMFAQGGFTPQRVQHIAALVLADIKALQSNPSLLNDLEVMAGIGASRKYPNKMHGDLMQHTKHVSRLPAPHIFRTTFKAPVGEQNTSMLLPHDFFCHDLCRVQSHLASKHLSWPRRFGEVLAQCQGSPTHAGPPCTG